MMANEPTPDPQSLPQTATAPNDEARFSRGALINSRSLYWEPEPVDHPRFVIKLIRWCLSLPEARLGVSPFGMARILKGLFRDEHDQPPEDVMQLFVKFGVSARHEIGWPGDTVWLAHRTDLIRLLGGLSSSSEYMWLEPDDARWWLEATEESLLSYAELFAENIDSDIIFDLMLRHRCTVFGPFHGLETWDHLMALIGEMKDAERQKSYREQLTGNPISREDCDAITDAYWSWRLIDFADADGEIIYSPIFSAWSFWPQSLQWAPPPPPKATPVRTYSRSEIVELLNDVFWVRLETIFSIAREACGLGQATTKFAGIQTRPPVFFYAALEQPPRYAEDYTRALREAITPLVGMCLGFEDPLSDQVAWGVVEGHLVALRSEMRENQAYASRYLLLPTGASHWRDSIERDIAFVADQLNYVEFTISTEADEIYNEIVPLRMRQMQWSGTFDDVADVTGDAFGRFASAGRRSAAVVNRRLASLHLILRRLESHIQAGASEANQLEFDYNEYVERVNTYIQRRVTIAALAQVTSLSLRSHLLTAYPYAYVKSPLAKLQNDMTNLLNSIGRSNANLNTILEQTDRQTNQSLASTGRWLSILLALFGALVTLLQIVDAPSTSKSSQAGADIIGFLTTHLHLPPLNSAAVLLVNVVEFGLLVASVLYVLRWVYQAVPKPYHTFGKHVQRFRALSDIAVGAASRARAASGGEAARLWRNVNRLDSDAVEVLAEIWRDLNRAREALIKADWGGSRWLGTSPRIPAAKDWELRARTLEHVIDLFDLAPNRISLPRSVCALRYKTADFFERTTVSDRDFYGSLGAVGFRTDQIRALDAWLTSDDNLAVIQKWDVSTFARALQRHGVSAIPEERKPDLWQGRIDAKL